MAYYDLTDQEKVELVKGVWNRYGTWILILLLSVALASFGWQVWQQRSSEKKAVVSMAYQRLLGDVLQGNLQEWKKHNEYLLSLDDEAATPWASLMMGYYYGQNNRFEEARDWLVKTIEDTATPEPVKVSALVHLVDVLISLKQIDEAERYAERVPEGYEGLKFFLLGDIAKSHFDNANARRYYYQALEQTDYVPGRDMILARLANLPVFIPGDASDEKMESKMEAS